MQKISAQAGLLVNDSLDKSDIGDLCGGPLCYWCGSADAGFQLGVWL